MADQPQFTENFEGWSRRHALGLALRLMPKRLVDSIYLTAHTAKRLVLPGSPIPSPASIVARPSDYAGPVHDASPEALLAGMQAGFYLQNHVGPLKWWSPAQRGLVKIADVHVAKRFKRSLRTMPFTVTFDRDFLGVLKGCADTRPGRPRLTWLHPKTQRHFYQLYELGYAHSVEVWDESGALVGGLFGVQLGTVFTALSMFHTADNASKLAIVSLYHHLDAWGIDVVDHQGVTPWVATLGGKDVTREEYGALLARPATSAQAKPGPWFVAFTPAQTAEWEPAPQQASAQLA